MLKKTGIFYNLCKHIGLFQRKKNPAVTAHVIHLGFCLLVMNIQCVLSLLWKYCSLCSVAGNAVGHGEAGCTETVY